MDEAALRERIGEMLSEVGRGPPVAALEAAAPTAGPAPLPARRHEMAALEDGLDQLRLAIKYLLFDLEATKRENRLLKEMLG
jgi:hypothetical protein